MPIRRPSQMNAPAEPARRGGIRRPSELASGTAPTPAPAGDEFPVGKAIAGGAALAGAALLARNPKAPAVIGKGLQYANALRQQLMLSGFAPLKSFAGNLGAGIAASAESGSLKPLKSLLSMDTVNDIKKGYASGGNVAPTGASVSLPGPTPGRIMNAVDEATQKALRRAGLSDEDAQRAVFQTPLGVNWGPASKVFDNPVMDYLFPFRRTPLNQFAEGGWVLTDVFKGEKSALPLAGYAAAGAAHGAATSDEQYPVSLPFGVALAAKYGLPYGVAALTGRALAGGRGSGNIAGSVLPVSEYGLSQSIEDPLAPYREPAALRALRSLTGGR